MRIGVDEGAALHQAAGRDQRLADGVCRAEDMHAGEQRHLGQIGAVVGDGFGHADAVRLAEGEIVLAVAWRHMHEAGALLGGDEVASEERHVEIIAPALLGSGAPERVGDYHAGEVAAPMDMHEVVQGYACVGQEGGQQSEGDDQSFAWAGEAAFGDLVYMDHRIFDCLAIGDGAAARHGPGSRRPDHHGRACERAVAEHGIAHPDRRGGVVGVLDFGFSQRGLFDDAPHDRAQAAVERAVQDEAADLACDGGFGGEIHRCVALRPIPVDPETAELGGLHLHPVGGVGAAFGPEIDQRHGVLVAAGFAVFFLDLPLDGQAMAVPAWDVIGVEASHLAGAVDHVLEDLVQRVADVDVAVRVGRAVVQDEGFAPLGLGAQLFPKPHRLPAGQNGRLALRQVAAHRERCGRQEDGVAVIQVAHRFVSVWPFAEIRRPSAARACSASVAIWARRASKPANFCSARR